MSDPIADFLTRIRNASTAGQAETSMPYSRLKAEMAGVLKREGYIADFYAEKLESGLQELKVQLKASGRDRAIVGIRRVSRPGLRVYKNAKELPRVLGGWGFPL